MATTDRGALEMDIDHAANHAGGWWTTLPFELQIPEPLDFGALTQVLTWTETGRVAEAAQVVKAPAPPKAKAIYSGDLEPLALLEPPGTEST